jgi:hypothetical protein
MEKKESGDAELNLRSSDFTTPLIGESFVNDIIAPPQID